MKGRNGFFFHLVSDIFFFSLFFQHLNPDVSCLERRDREGGKDITSRAAQTSRRVDHGAGAGSFMVCLVFLHSYGTENFLGVDRLVVEHAVVEYELTFRCDRLREIC